MANFPSKSAKAPEKQNKEYRSEEWVTSLMIEAQLPLYFLSSKRASSRVDLELRISRATKLGLDCWLKHAGKDTIKLLENGGLRNMVLSSKSEPLVARIGTDICPSLHSSVKQPAYGTEQETGRYAGMVTGHHGRGHTLCVGKASWVEE